MAKATQSKKKKRNWTAIIGALAAAVLAITAVLALVFRIGGRESDTHTANVPTADNSLVNTPSNAESRASDDAKSAPSDPRLAEPRRSFPSQVRPEPVAGSQVSRRNVEDGSAANASRVNIGSISSTNQSNGFTGVIIGNVSRGPER